MAKKPKAAKKPSFNIEDLLNFLNNPKVKAGLNLTEGKLNSQDVMGLTGGGQSAAAPYSGVIAGAANNKVKTDMDFAKGIADFALPISEGVRLSQGKSEPLDPLYAALAFAPFGKVAKKLKNARSGTKLLLDGLNSGSKMGRNMTNQQFSGSTDYTYSPLEVLLMQLSGK
jgi:hypothetical protein